jgi:hypothetical protein
MDTAQVTQLTFRAATIADIPELVALIDSAYCGDSSRAGWTSEADLLHGPADRRRKRGGRGGRTGQPDGGDGVERRTRRLLPAGEAGRICVLRDVRRPSHVAGRSPRQGVLAEAERFARDEWGAGEMHITVTTARAELVAWYVRRGYTRTGKLIPFPYDDERAGVPTRAGLQFEVLVKKLG